jgi:signal transduction histidine kinase
MTPADPTALGAPLLGLYIDEAIGRAAAIVAALTVHAEPDDADVTWALEAAHSLKGLTMQAGDAAVAEEVHAIESALDDLRTAPNRAAPAAAITERLRAVERALAARAGPTVARDVGLEDVASSARAEALRVAANRGVAVSVDLVVPADARIPRRLAGVLVDVLGHIVRNAVAHGTPRGGSVRIVFEQAADALVVAVSDRGDSDRTTNVTRRPDMNSGRGAGLRAARGRLAAIGGELTVSAGAWGGTSVTVRIPRD